jgi:hypothetical protein
MAIFFLSVRARIALDQFPVVKGLGQVVVGTALKSFHPLVCIASGSEKENGHISEL